MLSKIVAIARKDVQIFTADRKAMVVSFIVPIAIASFFCLIMGGAGSGSAPATKLKTLVVMEDKSEVSKLILVDLKKSDSIEVVPSTRKEATDKVTKGEASVAVIFPAKFGDDAASALFAGTKPKLEILYDPTKSTEKQIVNGALMQTMMSRISQAGMTGTNATSSLEAAKKFDKDPERRAAWQSMINSLEKINSPTDQPGAANMKGFQQPFEIKEKSLSASTDKDAEQKSTRAHIFAGMAVQGILFFGIDAAMSILRERRTGIWARLRAAPVNMNSLLLGRLLGSWLIALLIMLGVFAFGFVVMGVRLQGSWLGFGLIAALTALVTATFGLFVASLGKTEAQSRGFSVLAVLMMSMLGGAWFPAWMMPKWVQTISFFIPVRWAVDGFDAMLWRGQGFTGSIVPAIGLLGFAFAFAAIASVRFRKF